jgi:hypothetical protein
MGEIAKSISKFEGPLTQLEGFVVNPSWVEVKVAGPSKMNVLKKQPS